MVMLIRAGNIFFPLLASFLSDAISKLNAVLMKKDGWFLHFYFCEKIGSPNNASHILDLFAFLTENPLALLNIQTAFVK